MKRVLLCATLITHSLLAEPIDWRDNLIYPVNPPRSVTPDKSPGMSAIVLDALENTNKGEQKYTPVEEYISAYKAALEGRSFADRRNYDQARKQYREAIYRLNLIKKTQPDWNPQLVEFRLAFVYKLLLDIPE